jgi:hypothetical protein
MVGWRKLHTSDIALILCKGGKLQIISFTGEERDVFSFYALKML